MNRQLRRMRERETRKRAEAWSEQLTEVAESEWPPPRAGVDRPERMWRSCRYLAMLYAAPSFQGIEVKRLTVLRAALRRDGQWEQGIAWDELQRCKREIGCGDRYAVEIYPRERDRVQVANMRHLWILSEPLGIGWFAASSSDASASLAFSVALGFEGKGVST